MSKHITQDANLGLDEQSAMIKAIAWVNSEAEKCISAVRLALDSVGHHRRYDRGDNVVHHGKSNAGGRE
jgi:hypothetical protein